MPNFDRNLLEKRYGISLPDDYVSFLDNPPSQPEARPDIYENEITVSMSHLLMLNDGIRSEAFQCYSWPTNTFVIGERGNGDLFYIDISKSPAPVLCWHHDVDEHEQAAPSVPQFFADIRDGNDC